MKPSVRPGAVLLRRDATHLQVGTSPGIVIRDHPGLYPLLLSLDGERDLEALRRNARREIPDLTMDVADALAPLLAAGAVIETPPPVSPRLQVEIAHDGPSTSLARKLGSLLGALHIDVGPEPDLLVIVSSGEPHRAALADLVRCRVPHLVVVQDADTVRIGPLVLPGRTPCTDCADLHRAAWDPAWSALAPQFGRPVPSGVSALTQHAAVTEIAAACLAYTGEDRPSISQEIIAIGPDRRARSVARTAFHPLCICALLMAA